MTHDHEFLESHQSFQPGRVLTRVIKCDDSSIPYSRREITALIDDDNWKAVAEAVDTVGETLGGELALLDHPARHLFIFKKCKQTGEVITRR